MFEKLFNLTENRTTVRTELLAGLTTFLTMSYIIFVQTDVLGGPATGMDPQAVLLATCVVSAVATFFMGVFARYPIALAPGMGENFFFVGLVAALSNPELGFQSPWQVALGVIFLSGVIFLLLSLLGVREAIINAISPSLRNGIAVGIGLFIAYIGLQKGGLIAWNDAGRVASSWVMLNTRLFEGEVGAIKDLAIFLVGLSVAGGLMARRTRGAILWGILAAAVTAGLLGKIHFLHDGILANFIGLPQVKEPALFRMDIRAAFSLVCLPFILLFVFMDMFDTIGTLVGVAEQAGFMKNGKLPRANRALAVDAAGTVAGACMGSSTITSYIESAAGVAYGGRTGLTSVTVAALFGLSLLFSPIIVAIAKCGAITAPALVLVGAMMMRNARKIDWDDYSEAIPAFLIAIGIPLTYSIADGLALGFISYPIIKLLGGKAKTVSWLMFVLAVLLLFYFVFVRVRI